MRGIPYGRHDTAGVAFGCPRLVASASAFRRASTAFWYSGFRVIGVGPGGAIFGSTPRPPPFGTEAPLLLRAAFDSACVSTLSVISSPRAITALALIANGP